MAATSKGPNLSKAKEGGSVLTWILGGCVLVAGAVATVAGVAYFKSRQKKGAPGGGSSQPKAPPGSPQTGTSSGPPDLKVVNLNEY
jgi:hypothetical protein